MNKNNKSDYSFGKINAFAERTLYAKVDKIIYPDHRNVSVMDTPAVWKGISSDENRHGQQLLKYLTRTRMLLLCLDATRVHAGPKKMSLLESFLLINKVQ